MSVGYLALNTKKPPLDRPEVRAVIARAIDREKIVRVNFQGHATIAAVVTPPALGDFRAEAAEPGDGPAKKIDPPVHVTLWAMPNPRPYLPEPKKTAELIKADLAKVGVECEIVTYPWDVYLAKTRQGEHDMCLLGWTADVADPDNFLFTFFASENRGGTNYSFYENPAVDEALIDAQAEADPARRRALYQSVERTVAAQAPLLPLVHPTRLAAIRANVEGFELHPTGRVLFDRVRFKSN
jgi:peptide/nickel transport system substrate-binding protein